MLVLNAGFEGFNIPVGGLSINMSGHTGFMTSQQKAGVAVIGLLGAMVAFVISAMAHIDPSPLRIGATADEAWTYIHTNSPTITPTGSSSIVDERSSWCADARSIEHETRLYWRTNRLFATRKMIYVVNTNSVITSVRCHWKFTWPF
jgi:hypothetical protein